MSRTRARRSSAPITAPGHDQPGQAEPDRLVAGQRGQPDEQAEADQARVQSAAPPRGSRAMRVISRQAPSGEDRERHRRVGQGRVEEERQVDGAGQPGPERERPGASRRQAALRGDVRGEPPGEDRARSRPSTTDDHLGGARTVDAEERHRDGGEERRQRQPDLERRPRERERRRPVAPQRVRDEPAALDAGCARRRRSRPCPRASGRRSGRRRRRGRRARRRRSRPPRATPRGGSRGVHARPGSRRHRVDGEPGRAALGSGSAGRARPGAGAPSRIGATALDRVVAARGRASGCRRRARPAGSCRAGR